jgi:hypothetical protein
MTARDLAILRKCGVEPDRFGDPAYRREVRASLRAEYERRGRLLALAAQIPNQGEPDDIATAHRIRTALRRMARGES